MDQQVTPSPEQVFALRLFAQVCDGPLVLRDRLLGAGLDSVTIARVAGCSPRLLARLAHGAATPRGVLMRLAGLAVVAEQLRAAGTSILAIGGPSDTRSTQAIEDLRNQSDIARRLVDALAAVSAGSTQMQLSLAS